MRITRYTDAVTIDLRLSEAADLKIACETPEYHLPILTKIAGELARLEKEPTPQPKPGSVSSLVDFLADEMDMTALREDLLSGDPAAEDGEPSGSGLSDWLLTDDEGHGPEEVEEGLTEDVLDGAIARFSKDSTGDPVLDRLIDEHGGIIGAESSPTSGLRCYHFADGRAFYIQPDGTVMEWLEPTPDDLTPAPPKTRKPKKE